MRTISLRSAQCMMQDYPKILTGADASRVGFTTFPASICFSPVKNINSEGVAAQKKGVAPAVVASGEADQYNSYVEILRSIGVQVEEAGEKAGETWDGVSVNGGGE